MRERLEKLLGPWSTELNVSTFHSASATILRREAEKVGLTRSFVIYDDSDQLQLVKRAMREERVDPVLNPRDVLRRIDVERTRPVTQRRRATQLPRPGRSEPHRAYQQRPRRQLVDWDLSLLGGGCSGTRVGRSTPWFRHAGRRVQDTNPVQYELRARSIFAASISWCGRRRSVHLPVAGRRE